MEPVPFSQGGLNKIITVLASPLLWTLLMKPLIFLTGVLPLISVWERPWRDFITKV